MAQNNTIQYTITAKDIASQVFAQVAASAKGMGKSFADTFANTKEATEKMRAEVARFQSGVSTGMGLLGGDFSKFGNLLGALPGPIGVVGQAVGETLGNIINSTVEAAEGFRKLSEKTGASVEFLSGFTQAADDVFVSAQSVNSALTIFAKKLGGAEDAMDGSGQTAGEFAKKLQEIGIGTDNVEEALLDVADRFKDMKDGTEKTALAVQLFGKQGAELIPILNKGRDGIRDMAAEAKALGLVMTNETTESVTRLKSTLDNLNDRIEGAKMNLGKPLVAVLADAGDAFLKFDKQMQTSFMLAEMPGKDGTLLRTWKVWTEVNDKFVRTLGVANVAMHEFDYNLLKAIPPAKELTRATVDMGTALENVDGPTRTAGQLAGEMADKLRIATMEEYNAKQAAEELAAKNQALADATNNVNSAFNATPKAMDNAEKAMLLFDIATGKTTLAQFEQRQAMEAIRSALDQGIIKYPEAAKALIGLRDGTLATGAAFDIAKGAAKPYVAELVEIKKKSDLILPKKVEITMHNRWDGYNDLKGKYDSFQNKTITVTVNSAGGLPNVPGTSVEQDTGGNMGGGGGSSTPYTPPPTQPQQEQRNRWDEEQGIKSARSFTVNNPGIIINSVNGAAIAQQIARQNANVARRARARASLMG